MVGSGWLKRFEDKLATTLKAKPAARRGRAPQSSAQEAEVLEDRSLMSVSALFLSCCLCQICLSRSGAFHHG